MRLSWLEDEFSNPRDSGFTLTQVADIRSGGTPKRSRADFWEGDIPWLSPKDMRTTVLEDTSEHISEAALKDRASALAPPGTLFIVVRGMILAHTFPIVRSNRPMAFNQDIKALVPKVGFDPSRPTKVLHLSRAACAVSRPG
jgi:type I restriction enzyme S subunit